MKNQMSVEIVAPPEKIWPYLSQPEQIRKWYFLLQRAEYTGRQRGGIGSTLYFEDHFGSMNMKINYVVTEWKDNQILSLKMTSGNIAIMKGLEQNWTLESIPTGTRFTLRETINFPWGFFGEFMGIFIKLAGRSTMRQLVTKLKSEVEAQK